MVRLLLPLILGLTFLAGCDETSDSSERSPSESLATQPSIAATPTSGTTRFAFPPAAVELELPLAPATGVYAGTDGLVPTAGSYFFEVNLSDSTARGIGDAPLTEAPRSQEAPVFDPSSGLIAFVSLTQHVIILSVENGRPLIIDLDLPAGVRGLALSAGGGFLALSTGEGVFRHNLVDETLTRTVAAQICELCGEVAISPNARTIAFGTFGRIAFADADGGSDGSIYGYYGPTKDFAWSPDSSKVAYNAFVDQEARLFLADPSRGDASVTEVTGGGGAAAWSPDGKWIAVRANSDDGGIAVDVVQANGSGRRTLMVHYGGGSVEQALAWSPNGMFLASPGIDGTYILNVGTGASAMAVHSPTHCRTYPLGWTNDETLLLHVRCEGGQAE